MALGIGILSAMAGKARMARAAKIRAVVGHVAKAKRAQRLAMASTRRAAAARKAAAVHKFAAATRMRAVR